VGISLTQSLFFRVIPLAIENSNLGESVVEDRDIRFKSVYQNMQSQKKHGIDLKGAAVAILERHSGNTSKDTWLSSQLEQALHGLGVIDITHIHFSRKQFSVADIRNYLFKLLDFNRWLHNLEIINHQG